ncbi:ATP-binding cassette domain-containing protein, partial [bacterium]|nr:ATP-binding cassette domain-containing protein [bacterium]
MTILISCQSISKSFGAQPLFSDISMSFSSGERLGLIGPNGSGKSTLLKILAGFEQTDEGEISAKKGTKLVYLAQDDDLALEKTVEQTLLDVLADENIEDAEKYNRVQKWTTRAGFSDSDQIAGHLSGGWKKRLAILKAIILEPDLLFMDEPTNHLDLEGILWLEELLRKPDFAFIVVSHDRYFLENVTNRIIELNRRYPEGYLRVDGSYSDFIFHREAFLNNQIQLETVLANKLRRETEWLQRGPKARTTKARFRIEEAYRLRDEHSSVRRRNLHTKTVDIDFEATQRKTKKLLTAENISKTLNNRKLFEHLDLTLSPGKCLGLLGKNGTGKSTLINLLNGSLAPDEGEIRIVEGVKVIVFDQNREQLDQTESLKRALSPTGDSV